MKHTKGPWRVKPTSADQIIDSDTIWGEIAIVAGSGNHEVGQGNARLIAAAPEMLEELKETAEQMERILTYGLPSDIKIGLHARAEHIDNLIDKIEKGEKQ